MKKWAYKPLHESKASYLSNQLNISPIVAQILVNRGLDQVDDAENFLNCSLKDLPNPNLFKGMDKAVVRIIRSIRNSEKIVVYGDYDVDGTTATSILFLFFREIGFPIEFYIPHRINEGYSLNAEAIRKLKSLGCKILITVDCGISSVEEINLATELGIDVIVTDHHEVPEVIPKALAVINAHQKDCPYPAKEVCGAGVAFNLVMALRQKLREEEYFRSGEKPNLKKYLDLVALATVADVVPLVGVNRIFVKQGLMQMHHSVWPGINALKEVSRVEGLINATHLGFRLGPRLNACGRLYDASMGVQLLCATSRDEARPLAIQLDRANDERRNIENTILQEALAMLDKDKEASKRMGHVLYHQDWHPGVIGIVASKIAERACRPVILFGKDGCYLKGSGRTYGGVNLIEVLRSSSEHLIEYGGHQAAAGLVLQEDCLEKFRCSFDAEIRKRTDDQSFLPYVTIDAELHLKDINKRLVEEIRTLEPFGQGNPEPLFSLKKIKPKSSRIVGNNHLKFCVEEKGNLKEAIAFGMGGVIDKLNSSIDIAFSCQKNTYQGIESIVLHIKDMKLSSGE